VSSLKLKHKMLGLIVFLGILPLAAAGFTYLSLERQAVAERLAMQTKAGQTYLERINGIVYAIVMESRGIYMSSDWDSAKPFAEGIARHSADLKKVAELLSGTVLEAEAAALSDARRSFVEALADAHVAEAALERAIGERRY